MADTNQNLGTSAGSAGGGSSSSNWIQGVGSALGAINPLLGFGASLLGGLFGSNNQSNANNTQMEIARMNAQSQRETNEMNYRISRETNEWNRMMMDLQNKWNLEQWNRENEYNSPAEQVARLKAAGINPAFVMGNGSMSEASSIQSASPSNAVAPQMNSPYMSANIGAYDPTSAMNGAFTALNAYTKNQLDNAQSDNIRANTANQTIQNVFSYAHYQG